MQTEKLPVAAVVGSGTQRHPERAEPLGIWLAQEGFHLLTGGGNGVMGAVSKAFHSVSDRRGKVIGVLPGAVSDGRYQVKEGYPNPYVELAIRTHLPHSGPRGTDPMSRNHIIALSADFMVGLPGGYGTRSELVLAQKYGRPVIAWLKDPSEIADLPADIEVAGQFNAVEAFLRRKLAWRL